jgi:hypothetical protein
MAQILNVNDDGSISIANLALTNTSGNVTHTGFIEVTGNAQFDQNVTIQGALTVPTISVQNLVTPNGSLAAVGNWVYNTEAELNGKGFNWTWGEGNVQLLYRTGSRIWNSGTYDTATGYSINNIPVISSTALGSTITASNLTQVGTLQSLTVSGNTTLADLVYVDSTLNRIGVGTEEPNLSFSILDNNVEIGLGSPGIGIGSVGTYSSHDLVITTDNLPRITVKATGAVNIGDPVNGGGVLNVYGTLFATTIQTDNRIDRTQPLTFNATADSSIYGLGLVWSGTGNSRQLTMMANPDRLWSSENFDIGPHKAYYINGVAAVTDSGLGPTILNSSLVSVGTLNSLTVGGATTLSTATVNELTVNSTFNLEGSSINSGSWFRVSTTTQQVIYSDVGQTLIGDSSLQTKPVKVFGPLSVNVNNPDPSLQFSVNGDVNIGGKRFTNGTSAPTTGVFQLGDICWNTQPTPAGYVGWICIAAGTPGIWSGFGQIAS